MWSLVFTIKTGKINIRKNEIRIHEMMWIWFIKDIFLNNMLNSFLLWWLIYNVIHLNISVRDCIKSSNSSFPASSIERVRYFLPIVFLSILHCILAVQLLHISSNCSETVNVMILSRFSYQLLAIEIVSRCEKASGESSQNSMPDKTTLMNL